MKKLLALSLLLLLLCGCSAPVEPAQIAATTLPVYEFTSLLCEGTGLSVTRLVTEEVSCLHDYSLNVRQVKAAEAAELIVMNGAGLEAFLDDLLLNKERIDASQGIALLCPETHGHEEHEGHHHESDPHIWLSPVLAQQMARNIWAGLAEAYPQHSEVFSQNLDTLILKLEELAAYGQASLSSLSCREIITFHDGFSYFAQAFDLTILEAVEEESGSEASAKELIHLIQEVEHHNLPGVFTECNGSTSAAEIIAWETGAACKHMDMAMSGDSYFSAMYDNIDTIKEVLQ